MQCPSCNHEAPAASFGDPLRCPDCGAFYEKALQLSLRNKLREEAPAAPAMPAALSDVQSVVDKVPAYIKASLSTGEVVHAVFRLHWMSWVTLWLWILGALLTGGLLAPVAIYVWLSLRSLEQGVTNKRVIVKRGIISRKTEEMKLRSIETVELEQGVLGRIFGFGSVKVTGRGNSDVVIRNVDDPIAVKQQIESVSHPVD
ncbi:membrane protein YdbS with pleckstrin-like domain [Metapseudomonas resinovorans]|uniref:PH domain-containing protein n=1 Tax=Metapseudomonas resinovorans TaxID=53412 RepID=UPI003D1EDDE0